MRLWENQSLLGQLLCAENQFWFFSETIVIIISPSEADLIYTEGESGE